METIKQFNHAILDIGSNSFHFLIYKIESDKSFTVLLRKRIVCRLGLQTQNGKSFLSEEDFSQTERLIYEFLEFCRSYSCTMTATATSAVREAANVNQFITHIKKVTGVSIEILSGEREAFLIYKAILSFTHDAHSKNILCLDIGGGSTEFILGSSGKIIFTDSLKLGSVRMYSRFFQNGILNEKEIEECRSFIINKLQSVKQKLSAEKIDLVTGNSGTIHAVKAVAAANKLCKNDEHVLSRVGVDRAMEFLIKHKTIEERKTIPGIELDRADILPAGTLILQSIFHELNLSEIYLSDFSMREGKLLEILEQS